jgi:hypothetical protein
MVDLLYLEVFTTSERADINLSLFAIVVKAFTNPQKAAGVNTVSVPYGSTLCELVLLFK